MRKNPSETLAAIGARLPAKAALVHCDIGTGEKAANRALAAMLAPLIDAVTADGGLVVSDQTMTAADWVPVDLPEGVAAGRYNIARVVRAGQ